MIEVRCCCRAENLLGFLPDDAPLRMRELSTGEMAFSGEGLSLTELGELPGFVPAGEAAWRRARLVV